MNGYGDGRGVDVQRVVCAGYVDDVIVGFKALTGEIRCIPVLVRITVIAGIQPARIGVLQVQGDIPGKVAEVFVTFARLHQSADVYGRGNFRNGQQIITVIIELTVVELHRVYIVGNACFRHNVIGRSGNELNVEVGVFFVCQRALNDKVAAGEHYVVFGTVLFRGNFYVRGAFQQTDVKVACGRDRDIQAVSLDFGVVEGQPESMRGGGIRKYGDSLSFDRVVYSGFHRDLIIRVISVYSGKIQRSVFYLVIAGVGDRCVGAL